MVSNYGDQQKYKIQTKSKYSNHEFFALFYLHPYTFPMTHSTKTQLGFLTVNEAGKLHEKKFLKCLHEHPNILNANLASDNLSENPFRRLKSNWCTDLLI